MEQMPLVAQDMDQALPPTAALNLQHHEFHLFDDAAVDTVELAHVVQDHLLGGMMDDEVADAALSGLQGRFFVDDKLEPVLQGVVHDFPPWVFSTLLIAFGVLVAVILVVWWYWGDEILTLLDYDAVISTKLRVVGRGRRKGMSGSGTHARRSTHAGPYVNTQHEALALERKRQLLGATTTSAAGTKSRVADALIAYDLDTSDVQPPEKDDDEYPVGVMVLNDNSTPRSTSHSACSSRSASPAPPFSSAHRPPKAGRKGKVSLRVGPR